MPRMCRGNHGGIDGRTFEEADSRIEWRERRGSSNERERARTGAAPAMSLAAFGRPNWERRRSRNGKCHATTAGRASVRPPGKRPSLRKGSNGRLMSKLYSAPLLLDGLGSSSHQGISVGKSVSAHGHLHRLGFPMMINQEPWWRYTIITKHVHARGEVVFRPNYSFPRRPLPNGGRARGRGACAGPWTTRKKTPASRRTLVIG